MTEKIAYKQVGDYQIPDLKLPEENKPIGKYGRMREKFLKEHRNSEYTTLLLTGKLNEHLTEMDEEATRQVEQIVQEMAKKEQVNEELKMKDPQTWVGLMNNHRHAAEEIVMSRLLHS